MSELGRVDGRLLGMLRFCGIRQFPWKEALYSKLCKLSILIDLCRCLPIFLGTDTRGISGDVLFQSAGFDVERVSIAIGVTNLIFYSVKLLTMNITPRFLFFKIHQSPDIPKAFKKLISLFQRSG